MTSHEQRLIVKGHMASNLNLKYLSNMNFLNKEIFIVGRSLLLLLNALLPTWHALSCMTEVLWLLKSTTGKTPLIQNEQLI